MPKDPKDLDGAQHLPDMVLAWLPLWLSFLVFVPDIQIESGQTMKTKYSDFITKH